MQDRLQGVNQPPQLQGAQAKTVEFTHLVDSQTLWIYFTDGTYLTIGMPSLYDEGYVLKYDYVED